MENFLNFLLAQNIWMVLGICLVIALYALLIFEFYKKASEGIKTLLFIFVAVPILAATVFLVVTTVYKNTISATNGPVHYHADMEIWNCGKELDLVNPTGLSNKVGTELLHEHNDKRIHVEGAVLSLKDITLKKFFMNVGGNLKSDYALIPTTNGSIELKNGELCNGVPGQLQVFVYSSEGNTFSQQRITDPQNYILSPYSAVPPGDCIIIEFDEPKEKTDKMCLQYQVKMQKGELNVRN